MIRADKYSLNNTTEQLFLWSSNKDTSIDLLNNGNTAKLSVYNSGHKHIFGNTIITSINNVSWKYTVHSSVCIDIGINTLDNKNFIGIRYGRYIDSCVVCTLTDKKLVMKYNDQTDIFDIPDNTNFYHYISDTGINQGFSVSLKRITLNIDSLTIYSNTGGDVIITNNVSSNMVFINDDPLIDFKNTALRVKNIYSDNLNIITTTNIIGELNIQTDDNKMVRINPENIGNFGQVLSSDGLGGVMWKNSSSTNEIDDLTNRIIFLENVIFALTGLKMV